MLGCAGAQTSVKSMGLDGGTWPATPRSMIRRSTKLRRATILLSILYFALPAAGCIDGADERDNEREQENPPNSGGSSAAGEGPICGDGLLNGPEQCDALNVGGVTCINLGFEGGELTCSADCTFDTAECFSCGDGQKNGDEQCDQQDLGGASCSSLGLGVGQLGCAPNCVLDPQSCCVPQCSGKNCGPDGCGGQCGVCDSSDACCDGSCVAGPDSCSCTCSCSLTTNPNCQSVNVEATDGAETLSCTELCQNACSLGCGSLVSATGDCPAQATCD